MDTVGFSFQIRNHLKLLCKEREITLLQGVKSCNFSSQGNMHDAKDNLLSSHRLVDSYLVSRTEHFLWLIVYCLSNDKCSNVQKKVTIDNVIKNWSVSQNMALQFISEISALPQGKGRHQKK